MLLFCDPGGLAVLYTIATESDAGVKRTGFVLT